MKRTLWEVGGSVQLVSTKGSRDRFYFRRIIVREDDSGRVE